MAVPEKTIQDAQIEHLDYSNSEGGGSNTGMPNAISHLSDAEYKKLGRSATFKMDTIIMPCLVIMYILNYLDRQNIAAAKLAGIDKDLGLSATNYQTCVSILFVGYSE